MISRRFGGIIQASSRIIQKNEGTLQDSHKEAARAFRRLMAKGVIGQEAKEAWAGCMTRAQETDFINSTMSQSLRGEWAFDHEAPAVKDLYGVMHAFQNHMQVDLNLCIWLF